MRRARGAAVLVALAAGCASAAPPAPPMKQVADIGAPSIVSPARWQYHPAAPTGALAAVKLEGGGCVFTAEGGQRWTSASTKQAGARLVCSGKADAGAAVAAEDLTSAIRRADGSWIFVGQSGALFEAADPLGPFTRTVAAPEPLARVTAAGAGVLATTQDGRLLKWDEAGGWRAAVTSGPLTSARVFDVVVSDAGRALALAIPEALFTSEDGGATWAPAAAPAVGARVLGRTSSGELGALGIYESLVWRARGTPAFARGTEKIQAPQAALDVDVGRTPNANAVKMGRAVIDVDRYYEVVRPEEEGNPWLLARGRIDGQLESLTIANSNACSNIRLGARGKTVFIVCVAQEKGDIVAEVRQSTDQGATWSASTKLVTLDTDQIHVAVSPEGAALIVGVCRPEAGGGGCKPGAPVRVRAGGDAGTDAGASDAGAAEGSSLRAIVADVPQLSGAAREPAFSFDGRSAYFLGRRGKEDRIHLFVSHDAGATFSPRALEVGSAVRSARRQRGEEDEEPAEPDAPDVFEVDDESSLRAGDDGTVGMLLNRVRSSEAAYVLADEDGQVLQVSGPPVLPDDDEARGMQMIVSGHGRRVLAAFSASDAGVAAPVWESLDGGATWDRQAAPPLLVREYERGAIVMACALGGCLLGDTVTRVGWGGAGEPGGDRAPEPPPSSTPGARTPIVCELAKTPWARVEDAFGGLSYPVPIPGIHEAMRGRAVWSTMTIDKRTGAIGTVSAMLPESGEGEARVIARRMLGPKPGGQRLATAISASQHEGFAVVRVTVPVDAKGALKPGSSMRNVEVAWENFFEQTSGRARIADAGPIDAEDVALGAPAMRRQGGDDEHALVDALRTSLISITSRGIFVHPHRKARGAPAFFIDAAGKVERYEPHTWSSSSPVSGAVELRADASALNGELLGVGLVEADGAWGAVALARKVGAGTAATTKVNALSLLPVRASGSTLATYSSWAWSAKAPIGIAAIASDPFRLKAWAQFVGFRGDGTFTPPTPVPTLFDLGDRPRGCTPQDRNGTPRINAPLANENRVLFPGARHPVLVREPKPKNVVTTEDAFVLLTAGAVLHGTPASPCVAAWEAPEAPSVSKAPVGAILSGDLARSWLFRFGYEMPKSPRRPELAEPVPALEYRPMTCRYDPTARVPEAVWSEPGASRP